MIIGLKEFKNLHELGVLQLLLLPFVAVRSGRES
jgi:hypothetical protein